MKNLLKSINSVIMPNRKCIPDEYLDEFELDLVTTNIECQKMLCIILIVIDLFLLFLDVAVSRFWARDIHIFFKYGLYHIALLTGTVIFLIFVYTGKKLNMENVKLYKTAYVITMFMVLGISAVMSTSNAVSLPYAYIISMFSIASLVLVDQIEMYIVYVVTYFIFVAVIIGSNIDPHLSFAYIIFLATQVILASLFSTVKYSNFKKSFMDKKLILEKNAELNSLSTLLIRSNAVLMAQLETSQDGIIVIDKNGTVLCYNQKIIDILGLSADIVKYRDGMRIFTYLSTIVIDEAEFRNRISEAYRQIEGVYCGKIGLKSGSILDIYSAPILYLNEVYGKVWYARDITEKENMLEALRLGSELNEKLLQEAQKYDELKNEFFANISHEFRTPLNVLLGTLQLMGHMKTESYNKETDSKINKYIGSMKQNCYRLLRLTNNLIDITRLDTGFFELNLKYFNIVQVVEDITLSVADFVENKGLELIFDTDIEEKIIAVDEEKVERIVLNLLSNAIKFTRQKGMIFVNIHDMGDSIEISVKDTGTGIPEDKQTIIFERFRQVNSSLTRDHEGSGIGLSITKNLVELHGGSIRVISEVGKGSEFIVKLPCREIEMEDTGKQPAYINQSHVEKINIEFSDIYSA